LRTAAEANYFDGIVVAETSRLTRSPGELQRLEDKFLSQVRDQLLSVRTVEWAEKEIARRLAAPAADTDGPRRELAQVQSDLDRVVDAVAKIGFSAALESKLAELEARKQILLAEIRGPERTSSVA
jgi:hypothetical protein